MGEAGPHPIHWGLTETRSSIHGDRWADEGAVLDQNEDTITDGVLTARARLPVGKGAEHCVECGDDIPESRCKALPGARTCVSCQSGRDSRFVLVGINRPGSKNSQLR